MAAWKIERRRAERFKVLWTGKLTCYFPDHEENIEIKVVEVSTDGARLEVDTLKAGPYHLVIGSESSRFTLKVSLPDAALSIPIRIIWYSTHQERDTFNLGVLFLKTSTEVQKTIEKSNSKMFVITHGTYTMPDTARYLARNLQAPNKKVILTGSMIPLQGFDFTDAPFNLGYAIAKVQSVDDGVYVGMNGVLFTADEAAKNISEGRFYSISKRVQ